MIFEALSAGTKKRQLINIVDAWWDIYQNDRRKALEELAVVLLQSGGIETIGFNITEFPNENIKKRIFSSENDMSNIPISENRFFGSLKNFLDQLLQKNSWALIRNPMCITQLLKVIELMRDSPWDSVRAVSYATSMKILRHSKHCNNHLTASLPDERMSFRRMEQLFNKVHDDFFKLSLRDKNAYLREIPFSELVIWAKESPEIMLEDNMRKYILRGLRDSFIGNRKASLTILLTGLMKPLIIDKQKILFQSLLPELIYFLRSNEEQEVISLKIVTHALRFLTVKISTFEDENLSMCMYNKHESVQKEAVFYFCYTHLKNRSGNDVILEILKFYKKCPIKRANVLVNCLSKYLINHTSWRHWDHCLRWCSENNICEYLNILHEFVLLINTDLENNSKILDPESATNFMNAFSSHFSENWVQLIESDKIFINQNAHILMFKLASLFKGPKLFRKTYLEIISKIVSIFHRSESYEFMKECWSTILVMSSFDGSLEIIEKTISQISSEFIEIMNCESEEIEILKLSHQKLIVLIQTCKLDLSELWTSLLILVESNIDIYKKELVLLLLYHLLMSTVRLLVNIKSDSENFNRESLRAEENSFQNFIIESRIKNHSSILVKEAHAFIENDLLHLNDQSGLLQRMVIPRLFGNLIYVSHSPSLSASFFHFTDKEIEPYVLFCARIMNKYCKKTGATLNECCALLKDYAKYTIDGILSVTYLKFFIKNLENINSHSMIIIEIMDHLIKSDHGPSVAFAVVNGLIILHNEKKYNNISVDNIKETLNEIISFILKNIKGLEGKHYQMTGSHLYLYLEKLVNDGNKVFSDVAEMVKSTLSDSVKKRLISGS